MPRLHRLSACDLCAECGSCTVEFLDYDAHRLDRSCDQAGICVDVL